MPSRSIGDFRLKYSEFNFHTFEKEQGFRRPIPHFTGPYITHEPDVQVFNLTKDDKWLILATDGLWDFVSRKKAARLVEKIDHSKVSDENPAERQIINALFEETLNSSCRKHGITREYLAELVPGQRKRMIVDDVTILVLNLENQA